MKPMSADNIDVKLISGIYECEQYEKSVADFLKYLAERKYTLIDIKFSSSSAANQCTWDSLIIYSRNAVDPILNN